MSLPEDASMAMAPRAASLQIENDEYAAFVGRSIRAHARRIGTGDVDALADMTGLAAELDTAISHAIARLRTAGYSWAEIAARLCVTRQAAQRPRRCRRCGTGRRQPG